MTQRCKACILPETYPGIRFDNNGVCNFCRSYQPDAVKGKTELLRLVASRKGPKYDCVLTLSGGRDSSYVLYYVVRRLKLRTLVVHYDNGFRHDQARINAITACKKLEVDMLECRSRDNLNSRIAAAAIHTTVPYGPGPTCQYMCLPCYNGGLGFVYSTAEKYRIPFVFWGTSGVERLSFSSTKRVHLGFRRPIQYAISPRCFYFIKFVWLFLSQRRENLPTGNRPFEFAYPKLNNPRIEEVSLFDYIEWDRREIKRAITEELGWKKPDDSLSTWRFDCLLHEFSNYCFKKAIGFNHDIDGLANMIRAGKMERSEAIALLDQGFDSDKWTDKLENLSKYILKLPEKDIARIRSWTGPNGCETE